MKPDVKACRVKRLSWLPVVEHTHTYRRHKLGADRLLTLCYVDIAGQPHHKAVTIVGTAICSPYDNPSHKIGRAIAQGRASHLYNLWTEPDASGPVAYGEVRHPTLVELLHALGTPPYMAKAFILPYEDRVRPPDNSSLCNPIIEGGMVGEIDSVRWVEISPHDHR